MTETFIALLFAHAVADFLLQSKWMAESKRQPKALLAHTGVVFLTALIALGGTLWPAIFIALVHLQIDFGKARLGRDTLPTFLIDQTVHLISILIAVMLWPLAHDASIYPSYIPFAHALPQTFTLLTGAILSVRMGQFIVAKLMAPLIEELDDTEGLVNGGAIIGLLERGLTYILVLSGQAAGVGFLIAAKSFLRVGTIEKNRKMAEYVIIGTLASIGWALLIAFATKGMLSLLENGANLN